MFTQFQKRITEELEKFSSSRLPSYPTELYDPMRYTLNLGGKRMRPLLVLAGCDLFGEDVEKALPVAIAVELLHNFTLIHDDIMDEAPLRRSNPTVHKKWNANVAILSGDALLVKAYQLLNQVESPQYREVMNVFNDTALKICEGQQLDMNYEKSNAVSIAQYLNMIELKTAVLLAASLKMGALIAGAGEKEAKALYGFGKHIGIAFQLQDDILDVYGDAGKFGKQVGGDIISNKKTYLLLKSLEMSQVNHYKRDELLQWVHAPQFEPQQKVEAVLEIYGFFNVKKLAEDEMQQHYQKALQSLGSITADETKKQQLLTFTDSLMKREI